MAETKKTGAFISVEGADGSGKTTHLDFIAERLRDGGEEVVRTREPGGTRLGELLRDILLAGGPAEDRAREVAIGGRAELLLIFAARAQHLDEVIVPAIAAGKWVLCDRFTDATYAYQGGGRGIAEADIKVLENWVQKKIQPDITILFDVPVEVGVARTRDRGERADRFERQAADFKQAVRRVYRQRAAQFPSRIKLVDADRDIKTVRTDLADLLDEFWRARR